MAAAVLAPSSGTEAQTVQLHPKLLAGEVEEAVRGSIRALLERRVELAKRVIDGDDAIDQHEVELEEECLKILALHCPVASDLRFVVSCLIPSCAATHSWRAGSAPRTPRWIKPIA